MRFSIFNVPLERRLQTLAALFWVVSSPPFAPVYFIVCTLLVISIPFIGVPLFLLVLTWSLYDYKTPSHGGRPIEWFKRWTVWRYFRDFFPLTMVRTVELEKDRNYVFGYHPHGILAIGAFVCFCTEATGFSSLFPNINLRLLTLKLNLMFPFYRDYLMAVGVADVSEDSCKYILSSGPGRSLLIVIGGASESLETHPGTNNLTIMRRKGFVRVALQSGASLVPVFGFGENDVYRSFENPPGSLLRTCQEKLIRLLGFAVPVFHGRGIFNYNLGILPFRRPLVVVVGAPIDLPKIPTPTKEEIDYWHKKYLDQLQSLYDNHKDEYAKDRKMDLNFVQ